MNKRYVRDGLQYYMEIEPMGGQDYEYQMLMENEIGYLIPLKKERMDKKQILIYPTKGMKPFWITAEKMWISGQQFYSIVDSLLSTIKEVWRYMLNADNLVLETDCLFWELNQFKLHILYVPGYEKDILKQITELVEKLLGKIDPKDREGVYFAYGFHRLLKEGTTDFEELKSYMKSFSWEKPAVAKKEFEEKETYREKEECEEKSKKQGRKRIWLLGGLWLFLVVLLAAFLFLIYGYGITLWKRNGLILTAALLMIVSVFLFQGLKKKKEEEELIGFLKEREKKSEEQRDEKEELRIGPMVSETMVLTTSLERSGGWGNKEFPRLVSLEEGKEESIIIEKTPFVLGSYDKGVDWRLDARQISRFHAVVLKKEEDFFLKDLHSTNGTWINGSRLNLEEERLIREGDQITLANLSYRFLIND